MSISAPKEQLLAKCRIAKRIFFARGVAIKLRCALNKLSFGKPWALSNFELVMYEKMRSDTVWGVKQANERGRLGQGNRNPTSPFVTLGVVDYFYLRGVQPRSTQDSPPSPKRGCCFCSTQKHSFKFAARQGGKGLRSLTAIRRADKSAIMPLVRGQKNRTVPSLRT